MKSEIGSCFRWCSVGLVYRILDSLLMVIVMTVQNVYISYYMVSYNEGSNIWYFFFFADFAIIFLFILGAIYASRHYRHMLLIKRRNRNNIEVADSNTHSSKNELFSPKFRAQLGTLPLLWINWIIYALLFSVKIFVIHLQQIAQQLYTKSWTNEASVEPHTIKLCLASSTIVLLLWIELHRNHEELKETNHCAKELTTTVIVFEIFDSIELLDLLMPETGIPDSNIPEWVSIIILILATSNFLLPTIGLFELSFNSISSHRRGLKMTLFHNVLRIGLINIPYMFIRIYLWKTEQKEISIFLIKNILVIFVCIRSLVSDARQYWKLKNNCRNEEESTVEETHMPLSTIGNNEKKRLSITGEDEHL